MISFDSQTQQHVQNEQLHFLPFNFGKNSQANADLHFYPMIKNQDDHQTVSLLGRDLKGHTMKDDIKISVFEKHKEGVMGKLQLQLKSENSEFTYWKHSHKPEKNDLFQKLAVQLQADKIFSEDCDE